MLSRTLAFSPQHMLPPQDPADLACRDLTDAAVTLACEVAEATTVARALLLRVRLEAAIVALQQVSDAAGRRADTICSRVAS